MKANHSSIPADLSDPDDFEVSQGALERGCVSKQLRMLRTGAGLTQASFANRLRVPLRTLQEWEQARATPPSYAIAFARVVVAEPEAVERALA